ncbi:diguanylate cyclase [Aphanothece hegewaldii CCALA 016]|uniref:Diguanylate cyclase n=1 Tax=Aphanothece hegewaldii CCALA 016 TaxID=2107694 RepID=A0A2T1M0Y3_9CHRO|nr:EAL domain-containing protein [Aphanothece hegewaldii]PSF38363.1 diguanylate cyclase [Aphanothece hegewaldii CCALA 016]
MSNAQDIRHVLVVEDQKSKRIVSLKESTYSIGRDPTSSIILYDRQVSRHHATLLRVTDYQNHQEYYRIIDGSLQGKKSTNGLTVNGKYCFSQELKTGDAIRFGSKVKASYHLITDLAELDNLKASFKDEEIPEITQIQIPANLPYNATLDFEGNSLVFKGVDDEATQTAILSPIPTVEGSPFPMFELNFAGELISLNAAAKYKFPDLKNDSANHPILDGLVQESTTKEGTSYVREIQVGDDTFEQHIHYLPDSKVVRSYLFEITKYKRLEIQLNQDTSYYRFLVEQTSEGILLIQSDSKIILDANPSYCRLTGYELDELKQLNLYQIVAIEREIIDDELAQVEASKSYHVEESLHRCRDGSLISVEARISRGIFKKKDVFCLAIRDISERKRSEERMQYQAFHDALTNLPNRVLFNKQLAIALAEAQRNQTLLAVMFLDLDSFKHINNTLGHKIGDEILQSFSRRLTACVRTGDTVARWESDEFTVLLPRIKNTEDTVKLSHRIFDALKQPFVIEKYKLQLKTSIGIAIYPQDGDDQETLLKNADAALSRTKKQGRNHFQFYTPMMSEEASVLLKIETLLHQALDRQEFSLVYQPQINMKTGEITGMEALLRWNHPELGAIAPSKFLPLAEKTDLMLHIGKWVLTTACRQNLAWQKDGLPPISIGVNLSGREFQQPNLAETVARVLDQIGLDPQWLELEFTEKTLRQHLNSAPQIFQDLQNLGVRLCLDDFCTGPSAIGYLKQFSLRTVKINQTFIRDLRGNTQDLAIISAITALGRGFNTRIIAEAVETQQQIELLQSQNCYEAQGYWFSRPLNTDNATQFLINGYAVVI